MSCFTGFEDRAKTYTSKRKKNTINGRFPYGHFSINNLYIFVWIYYDCSTMVSVYALDPNIVLQRGCGGFSILQLSKLTRSPPAEGGSGDGST